MVETRIIDNDIIVIDMPARLGIGFKDEDFNEVKQVIADTSKKLVINLENTKAIDSSTIGVFLKKYVDYKNVNREKHIAVCCLKNVVKRSLEIIPIDKYMAVFDNVEDAVKYMKEV